MCSSAIGKSTEWTEHGRGDARRGNSIFSRILGGATIAGDGWVGVAEGDGPSPRAWWPPPPVV